MRVGIDARLLTHGIGRYTEELVTHLAEVDTDTDYYLFANHEGGVPPIDGLPGNFHWVRVASPLYSLREQFELPFIIARQNLDLFHATSFGAPMIRGCPLVVTIHDLALKVNRKWIQYTSAYEQLSATPYYECMNYYSMTFSSRIIAVSRFTADQIRSFYPKVPADKIKVIRHSASSRFRPAAPAAVRDLRTRLNLPDRYVLFVGSQRPWKNLEGLVRAWAVLVAEHPTEHALVIAALNDKRFPGPIRVIEECNLGDALVHLGYVATEDLPALYTGATVIVLPSFHESYGLPLIEALSCGTPVVCSNAAGLPETGQDAPEYFDPQDIRGLVDCLYRVLEDPDLRAEMRRRGFDRARSHSWQDAARAVVEIYRETV